MPSSTAQSGLEPATKSLLAIITHCRQSLTAGNENSNINTLDALSLLHDSASLVKAHSTRLAIALRPPISLDIAKKFITELSSQVIPGLILGVESMNDKTYGKVLCAEVKKLIDAVLGSLEDLVRDMGGQERLIDTAVLWVACDQVVALKTIGGLPGVVGNILHSHGEMVSDAAEELKEWISEERPGHNLTQSISENGEEKDPDQEFWDSLGSSPNEMTPELLNMAKIALKQMKLVSILCAAGKKRRLVINSEGRITSDVQRLDRIADLGKDLSGLADDLGMAFYDAQLQEAMDAHNTLTTVGVKLAQLLSLDDSNQEDRFTVWFEKCEKALIEQQSQK
ncbi:hypothetical protein EDC01DRAFT_634421 [Geopyxis carbonaria]|nr:hypothetical protein EDC01DRAFT_634421 [Geopyxis carbonaria]